MADVRKLFTSSDNIAYLRDELSKQIGDKNENKEYILDSLIIDIFHFQDYDSELRQSFEVNSELEKLNKAFIQDRLYFASAFNLYEQGQEYYADQMFIDDSLRPGPYKKFNEPESKIPLNQRTNRNFYSDNEELRESETSQIRSINESNKNDFLTNLPTYDIRPKWID